MKSQRACLGFILLALFFRLHLIIFTLAKIAICSMRRWATRLNRQMFNVYFTRGYHLHVPWDWKFLLLAWVIAQWVHYLMTADPFQVKRAFTPSQSKTARVAIKSWKKGWTALQTGSNGLCIPFLKQLSPKFMCRVRIAQMDEIIEFPFQRGCARSLTSSSPSTPPLLIENTLTTLGEACTCMPAQHFSFTKDVLHTRGLPQFRQLTKRDSVVTARLSSSCRRGHWKDIKLRMTGAWLLFMAVPDVLCLHGCFGKDDLYHDVRNQRFSQKKTVS